VICPDADVKIFVTANVAVRAERRWRELEALGITREPEQVLAEMRERDERDTKRSTAPLAAAADAHILDTSALDIEGAFQAAARIVAERGPGA